MTAALPFSNDHEWRWRWMYPREGRSGRLHRIAQVEHQEREEYVGVVGTTLCGERSTWAMPGVISRMNAPRCRECAKAAGVKVTGRGSPFNTSEKENPL